MSYCRFGAGNVYMYPAANTIECCMCIFGEGDQSFATRSEALAHLMKHRDAGHEVPQYAIDRLKREIRDTGEDAKLNPWAVYDNTDFKYTKDLDI